MNKEDLKARCTELGLKFQDNDTNEQLKQMIEGAEAIAKVAELEALNKELNASISSADQESEVGLPTVKHEGVVYALPVAKATLPKGMAVKLGLKPDGNTMEISREQIAESAEIRAGLLKMGSGLMVEVATEEKED